MGQPLAVDPAFKVTDANGLGVPGVSVTFQVVAGQGSIATDSVVTNSEGVASGGDWRMGTTVGVNALRVQVLDQPLMLNFTASSTAGAPATISELDGQGIGNAIVGQPLLPKPGVKVRDSYGNPVPGATVTWAVTSGGGTVTPAQTTSDASGVARVGTWTLGPAAGLNLLKVSIASGTSAILDAMGVSVPAVLVPVTPQVQTGVSSFQVPQTARARVLDNLSMPISGIPVVFEVVTGDGMITGDTVHTDSDGVAALIDWRLGPGGSSTIMAHPAGQPAITTTFSATGTPLPFTIDLRFITDPPADMRDAFVAAARRWMEVIVGDLPDQNLNVPAGFGFCAQGMTPAVNEMVDDVIIYAAIVPDDGPGGILGSAGPCFQRNGSLLTVMGGMVFDIADAAQLQATGRFEGVAIHEMGHVLGMLNQRWAARSVAQGLGGTDPIFTGLAALAAWPGLASSYAGAIIPIENSGGQGTADSHWRESVLESEIMTGYIEGVGVFMPLSAITVGSLHDIGYTVDMSKADPFDASLRAAPLARAAKQKINEIITGPTHTVGPDGRPTPIGP